MSLKQVHNPKRVLQQLRKFLFNINIQAVEITAVHSHKISVSLAVQFHNCSINSSSIPEFRHFVDNYDG